MAIYVYTPERCHGKQMRKHENGDLVHPKKVGLFQKTICRWCGEKVRIDRYGE